MGLEQPLICRDPKMQLGRMVIVIVGIFLVAQIIFGVFFLSQKKYRSRLRQTLGVGINLQNSSKGCSANVQGLKMQYADLERKYNDTLLELQLLKASPFSLKIEAAAVVPAVEASKAVSIPHIEALPAAISLPPLSAAQPEPAQPHPAHVPAAAAAAAAAAVPPSPPAPGLPAAQSKAVEAASLIVKVDGAAASRNGTAAAAGADLNEPFHPEFWGRIQEKRKTRKNTPVPATNESWDYLFASPFLDDPIHLETKRMMLAVTDEAKRRVVAGKKYYITYGQHCCAQAKKLACDAALKFGFDECFAFDLDVINTSFRERNKKIFDDRRGAGLWLWKPYIIYQMLGAIQDGDYLVYADAGSHLESPIHPLLGWLDTYDADLRGVLTFSLGFKQSAFCKRDAFISQRCDSDACHDAGQIDGFLSVWRRSSHAVRVAGTWLHECQDHQILSDLPNTNAAGLQNLPNFRAHRHDQALLTNIFTREGWGRDTSHAAAHNMFKHDRNKSRRRARV